MFNNANNKLIASTMLTQTIHIISMLLNLFLPIKNTVINPGDTINATLYIKENIFYRDPVLYQPGGYQIKDISYPATLNLLIDNVNNTKTIYFNN